MKTDNVSTVLLHECPEYSDVCANLLNTQWKRSYAARIHSLSRSSKELPDSMVLLEEEGGEKRVIGHSRLTRVLEDDDGCWIESVVIAEDKRGKGYGKFLMNKTEEYAKELNFSTVYLSTQDQQEFYKCIGYIYAEPVSSINFQKSGFMMCMFPTLKNKDESKYQTKNEQIIGRRGQTDINKVASLPPPPPPAPPLFNKTYPLTANNIQKYWMKKYLY